MGVAPADWPSQIQDIVPMDSVPCAGLSRDAAGEPLTLLGSMERNALAAALPGSAPVEEKLNSDKASGSVLGGSGALVRANAGGELGQVMLVSDLGLVHGLGNSPVESLSRLGYEQARIVDLPAAWTQLIPPGTTLDKFIDSRCFVQLNIINCQECSIGNIPLGKGISANKAYGNILILTHIRMGFDNTTDTVATNPINRLTGLNVSFSNCYRLRNRCPQWYDCMIML